MRIGIVSHNYPLTSKDRKDAGIFIHDFAHQLSRYTKVFVLCPNFFGKKENYKQVPVTWFKWSGGKEKVGDWKIYSPLSLLKFINLLLKGKKATENFVKDNDIDFLLGAWGLPAGVLCYLGGKKTKTPYAIWSLGSDVNKYFMFPVINLLMKLSYQKTKILFANSFSLMNRIKKLTGRTARFMPAITDFEKVKTQKVKMDRSKTNFLFVGRLEKVKGIDILIDALNKLVAKDDSFVLNILGDGSLRKEMETKVKSDKLGSKVTFLGLVGKETVASYMKQSSCLIVPSRSESLPLVIIEAARMNLPVIATDVGDCKRIIKKYRVGYWVGFEDRNELVKAMLKFINLTKAGKIGMFGRGLAALSKDFTQEKAVQVLLDSV